MWNGLIYPIGQFTIWVERTEVSEWLVNLLANKGETLGLFPYVALGGETGIDGEFTLCGTLSNGNILILRAE